MRVRMRRPQYQRRSRAMLAFALTIPAAGILSAAGANSVSTTASAAFVLVALVTLYDAYRVTLIVTRYGIGIAGPLFATIRWFAWSEILEMETDDPIVSLTMRTRELYQIHLDPRSARFLASMASRSLIVRPPL